MSDPTNESMLARLAGRGESEDDFDPWASLVDSEEDAAESGAPVSVEDADESGDSSGDEPVDQKLDQLLNRINTLRGANPPSAPVSTPVAPPALDGDAFVPRAPETWSQAGVTEGEVEALILKFLLSRGNASGVDVAEQVKLPFKLIETLLYQLKNDQLVYYRNTAQMGDYVYQLTDMGRERGRRYADHSSYFGSAPVDLEEYIASVKAQSLSTQHPSTGDLLRAFDDLLLNKRMLNRLGPAINSGRGLFLYGAAGNGKTSIAERVTLAFGQSIWIPRAIGVDGEIIRVFDPSNHEELPWDQGPSLVDEARIDRRWVRIRRPTIVVGGELTMSALEVTVNGGTGICEAPLQLKSNCGTLVIDDFGRQRMSTDELLNRWIVPLEKRYDFLNLPNGKKIQVPFDQLIIFSTNLQPKDLVDDAFLRRIPYKIDVIDPTEEEFRELFRILAPKMGFVHNEDAVSYLIETHYKPAGRPFRCCHPRDLLLQIRNFCYYQDLPPEMAPEQFDFAVTNYFAVM